ncbi:hypothetical protein N431DRAFT_484812 [Stipitochalara longipes BDJ]|nr:hypothetical protein N431DRAFT_484812 [Stipitochalara longipes BDJ]
MGINCLRYSDFSPLHIKIDLNKVGTAKPRIVKLTPHNVNLDHLPASQHPASHTYSSRSISGFPTSPFLGTSNINNLSITMVSLLDLPGEIRNQIWDLCLVSPTGTISPLSRRDAYYSGFPGSCSHSGPFFYLIEEEKFLMERDQAFHPHVEPTASTISLSLPRTCRKIFEETNNLFWTKNTFYFPTPHRFISTFKFMGKYPQRRITSLRLCATPWLGNEIEWLEKALQLLISQRNPSSLRHLELLVDKETIIYMLGPKLPGFAFTRPPGPNHWSQKLLSCLKLARCLCSIEKNLVVTHTGTLSMTTNLPEALEETLWEIQDAWEGKVYWGSKMFFEDMNENAQEIPSTSSLQGTAAFEVVQMESLG